MNNNNSNKIIIKIIKIKKEKEKKINNNNNSKNIQNNEKNHHGGRLQEWCSLFVVLSFSVFSVWLPKALLGVRGWGERPLRSAWSNQIPGEAH